MLLAFTVLSDCRLPNLISGVEMLVGFLIDLIVITEVATKELQFHETSSWHCRASFVSSFSALKLLT